jgi:hypothetical protein
MGIIAPVETRLCGFQEIAPMDLLKAVALSAALMVPVIAGLQDLNAQDLPAVTPASDAAPLKPIDSGQGPQGRLAGAAKTIQADAKPDAIRPDDARL